MTSTADRKAILAAALSDRAPLTLIAQDGPMGGLMDTYTRAGYAYVIPGLYSSMPPALLDALRARRRANITGMCPACDGTIDANTGQFRHPARAGRECPASDPGLSGPYQAWFRSVGTYARGRRLVEDPA